MISRDIAAGIVTLWVNNGLDAAFSDLWHEDVIKSEHTPMIDYEPYPDQPMPYCIFEQGRTASEQLMSGGASTLRDIRSTLLTFRVHVSDKIHLSTDTRTAAAVAVDLVGRIQEVYGGHHAVSPPIFPLPGGCFLRSKYLGDEGQRRMFTGSKEKLDFRGVIWVIRYELLVDVAVAA